MKRSGVADLPLHGGRVPAWLASRMVALGTAISEAVIVHYGRSALLSRLSDPFWGRSDKLDGMARLDKFARAIETCRRPEADIDAIIANERAVAPSLGGQTVMDPPSPRLRRAGSHQSQRPRRGQLNLFER